MTRAPTEFRYWDRLDRPAHRWMRRASRALGGFDLAPPDDVVRAFADMYYDADPLAEAFVRDVYLTRGMAAGRAMLEDALANGAGPEAPASLRALFADIDEDPPWLDRDRLERGARVFRRWGTSVFRFAGAVTLAAYSESSVAKPLALTGAYAGASTKHRFLETAAFWIAVSEPGGMRPGGAGPHDARLRARPPARAPRLGPRGVGRAHLAGRRAADPDGRLGRARHRLAGHGLPPEPRRHRGHDALLALRRTRHGRAAEVVPRVGRGGAPARVRDAREVRAHGG